MDAELTPSGVLVAAIYGQLKPHEWVMAEDLSEADAYSAFNSRSDMMRYSSTNLSGDDPAPRYLWGMNDAQFRFQPDGEALAMAQVGIDGPELPPVVPVLSCLWGPLRRLGRTSIDRVSVTATVYPQKHRPDLNELQDAIRTAAYFHPVHSEEALTCTVTVACPPFAIDRLHDMVTALSVVKPFRFREPLTGSKVAISADTLPSVAPLSAARLGPEEQIWPEVSILVDVPELTGLSTAWVISVVAAATGVFGKHEGGLPSVAHIELVPHAKAAG